ncbi:hypothetical protein GCM10011348_29340 [Marinobacterium nitratireducens]|uniref:TM2 domain-containing protein n=1 Tax=Marinobacterium nitratireducens TaxID=518897 RepID=A0A917ZJS7_9GAMM|nr:TM2 domain-containing protein [Marinobacterium nitratireducens]GGO84034.1 hypothetical protein GCM10011348_29340 [Marinobacterium nitratireducens]
MSPTITFQNENWLRQKTTAYLLLLVIGTLGAHRYYLGHWMSGFIMTLWGLATAYALVTGATVGYYLVCTLLVWCLLDLAYIHHVVNTRRRKVYELRPLLRLY